MSAPHRSPIDPALPDWWPVRLIDGQNAYAPELLNNSRLRRMLKLAMSMDEQPLIARITTILEQRMLRQEAVSRARKFGPQMLRLLYHLQSHLAAQPELAEPLGHWLQEVEAVLYECGRAQRGQQAASLEEQARNRMIALRRSIDNKRPLGRARFRKKYQHHPSLEAPREERPEAG